MILVTLGTQDKPFDRLLKKIDNEIKKGNIKDEVVVQAGCTKYKSKNMKIFDLIPMDEFDNLMDKCDILITHGGVGSIIGALKKHKKVIAAARLAKYGEHINDHQKQIIENFDKKGYIIPLNDEITNLEDALIKCKKFKPNEYESNNANMIKLIEDLIDKF
jgi:UDP-N-acetylglucosamine transferase subunit ALG13